MIADQLAPTLDDVAAAVAGGGSVVALQAPVWILWRRNGKLLHGGWHAAPTLQMALQQSRANPGAATATAVEICLTQPLQPVPADQITQVFGNRARGRLGIEIRLGTARHRVPPTLSIATNRSLPREIELFAEATGLSVDDLHQRAEIFSFTARQFVIGLGSGAAQVEMYRGNIVIPPEAVGPDLLRDTVTGLCDWMLNNVAASGRMTYKYWPSRGAESQADNTIRQFMATVALGRIAQRTIAPAARDALLRNLAHNLARYYTEIGGLGAIILDGKAKLGAAALAALAILESRANGFLAPDAYAREFDGLCRGIAHLWQPDGAFRTFLVPPDRNDNQNFYPGEALLFWAALHRQTKDPELADKCLKSFAYYSAWHRDAPNPAFVPWHVQAYVMLHEDLGLPALAEFVFERCDWLLEMQQWGGRLAPDLWGRFYNPKRPDFGPPHASATGVYMEGLADAWRLALQRQDTVRADRYAKALRRALRSVAQLQFRDPDSDMFYIARPKAARGGLRAETYNNEIRVDNVQHCLMALLKFDTDPRFPWPAR
ncbi:MAG: hypothetical protein PHX82_12145 [Paracoccaceae bacterium]|nr:hypothetical protein [Paracoccaceae bacterium]